MNHALPPLKVVDSGPGAYGAIDIVGDVFILSHYGTVGVNPALFMKSLIIFKIFSFWKNLVFSYLLK